MRVAVVGGTRFIGAAVVENLAAGGHEVLVVHRDEHEPGRGDDVLAEVAHLHANRRELGAGPGRAGLAGFGPEVREGPEAGGQAPPGWDFDPARYEKLDVERAYQARGGTVLRLPFTHGERDTQRREEAVLARVRAGRSRIPVGPGTLLWSKGWVRDVAAAVRLAVQTPATAGLVLNLAELRVAPMDLWLRRVLTAAGADGRVEPVRVPDELVPDDLRLTRAYAQHLLVDAGRARQVLGWRDADPVEAVTRSVAWHLEHPPAGPAFDPAADDRALAAAAGRGGAPWPN